MIPDTIHFVFGMKKNFGELRFNYIHYLAVASAWKVHRPNEIIFHYRYEPSSKWWRRAKPFLTLNKVDPPNYVFGNPVEHYAHKSDVVRMRQLKEKGGIYLDMDVITLNSFDELMENKAVLGLQENKNLCNAVMLFESESKFLKEWYKNYENFDHKKWDYHSVVLPGKMVEEGKFNVRVEDSFSFFYPKWNESKDILFSEEIGYSHFRKNFSVGKMVLKLRKNKESAKRYFAHAIPSKKIHKKILEKSYCIHLWQSQWKDKLSEIDPNYIISRKDNFSLLIKQNMSERLIKGSVSV